MNKPKEEMSEEEKKQLKEYEKKLATIKEEQEKLKKALETELRKLQTVIGEIADGFDRNLRELFQVKLSTDQLIYQTKVKLIKLQQATMFSEKDEEREARISKRLEHLKNEKVTFMSEIPEIKKELEKCREEYEGMLKREKEIERAFRKEFSSYDFFYDALFKLFKRRDPVTFCN
jgi:hypothetical protein